MGTMNSDAYKMFLQNIEEYVLDEEQIVTYKWLSKNFDIHVNTAKQLLYSFASENKDKVHLTYLICGLLKNGIGGSVKIVREEDVNKIKSEFKRITSEHVYSVQKAKILSDLNILYTVDVKRDTEKDDVKQISSIKCDYPVLRPLEEVAILKRKTQSAAVDTNEKKWPVTKKPNISSTSKGTEDKKQIQEASVSKTVTACNGENNTNKKEQKKGGIAAMFAAQNTKIKQPNDSIKSKTTEAKKPKLENGISAFFSRQVEKPLKTVPKNDSGVSSQSDSQDSPKKMEIDSENTADSNTEVVKDKKLKNRKNSNENSNTEIVQDKKLKNRKDSNENSNTEVVKDKKLENRKDSNEKSNALKKPKNIKQKVSEKKVGRGKTKKASIDEEVPSAKKRKRIVVFSDSEDSEDDGNKEEEEDEGVCYSPAPQPQEPDSDDDVIPPTPDASMKKGRKRIRKLVDKTYMGEDGYMLTRKEYVFESCTESEAEEEKEKENKSKDDSEQTKIEKVSSNVDTKEPPAKKNTKESSKNDTKEPPSKKKKVSPQITKQASIMNFFKKK
ncbi:hypothetical protein L9F63_003605 [Diploptera punctata]|uniref:DNA polymerase delta subunit 3 n=1 Tax=Diploptera punctata TaxID=6984 RepID=A0AAD7ZKF8_DIPPU|nr:hypothetical protein L9F63_003605 [Diploptera punctata]